MTNLTLLFLLTFLLNTAMGCAPLEQAAPKGGNKSSLERYWKQVGGIHDINLQWLRETGKAFISPLGGSGEPCLCGLTLNGNDREGSFTLSDCQATGQKPVMCYFLESNGDPYFYQRNENILTVCQRETCTKYK